MFDRLQILLHLGSGAAGDAAMCVAPSSRTGNRNPIERGVCPGISTGVMRTSATVTASPSTRVSTRKRTKRVTTTVE
jgi:hypothetical protein